MGRIYAKVQKNKMNQDLDEILAMLDDMKGEDFQISKQKILNRLEEMIPESKEKQSEPVDTGIGLKHALHRPIRNDSNHSNRFESLFFTFVVRTHIVMVL